MASAFKRIVFIFAGVLVTVFCPTWARAAEPMKMGFVLSTLQEERYQKDQKYFQEEAQKLGFTAVMVSADNNLTPIV